jgi:hypothetical protein
VTSRLPVSIGWILTPICFAMMGALCAYLLLEDFHGHALRLSGVIAAGAALMGLGGWAFSGRMARAAVLTTSALPGLAVGGAVAVVLATLAVGPLGELTIGSGSGAMQAVTALAVAAVGMLPLIGVAALLAGIETTLAARRRRVDAKSVLRPILGHLVLGAVLTALVAYTAIFQHTQVAIIVASITPDEMRTSGWMDEREDLFREVLGGAQCDVLIVPFEAADRSVDRAGRSLMTRMLAAGVADRTALCVLDPTLAARALGVTARRFPDAEVFELAAAIDAKWVVRTEVAVLGSGREYELTVTRYGRDAGSGAAWGEGEGAVWGPVTFSDRLAPEAAFEELVGETVEHLGLGPRRPASPPAALPASLELPRTAAGLVEDPGSPSSRAWRLQLLAATYSPLDVDGQHLWERSIVALRGFGRADSEARMLRARAALHLGRRPYALALLEGLDGADVRALQAVADGDLPAAEAAAGQIAAPIPRLIVQLETEQLRAKYGRTKGYEERRNLLLESASPLAAWLYVPLSTAEWFQPAAHELVRRQLAALDTEVPEQPLVILIRKLAAQFGLEIFFTRDVVALPVAIQRSYRPVWLEHAAVWRARPAGDRLAEWDLYDGLYAANRAAVANTAYTLERRQARHEALLEFGKGLGIAFSGYPPLEVNTLSALYYLRQARREVVPILHERQRRLAFDIVRWEGGHTELNAQSQWAIWPRVRPAWVDEPLGPWGSVASATAPAAAPQQEGTVAAERRATTALRALDYSQYEVDDLREAWSALRRLGRGEDADRLLHVNRSRFAGNPKRDAPGPACGRLEGGDRLGPGAARALPERCGAFARRDAAVPDRRLRRRVEPVL